MLGKRGGVLFDLNFEAISVNLAQSQMSRCIVGKQTTIVVGIALRLRYNATIRTEQAQSNHPLMASVSHCTVGANPIAFAALK